MPSSADNTAPIEAMAEAMTNASSMRSILAIWTSDYKLPVMITRITRRRFLGGAILSGLASSPVARALGAGGALPPREPRVDAQKLRERLEALSLFGRPAGGT